MERHRHRPDRRSFGEVLLHTFLGVVVGAVLGGLCFFGLALLLGVGGESGWHPLLGSHLIMVFFIWMIPAGALAGGLAMNCWMAWENRRRRSRPKPPMHEERDRPGRNRRRPGSRTRSLR